MRLISRESATSRGSGARSSSSKVGTGRESAPQTADHTDASRAWLAAAKEAKVEEQKSKQVDPKTLGAFTEPSREYPEDQIQRISAMTDADFNNFYDEHESSGKKEANHIVWI